MNYGVNETKKKYQVDELALVEEPDGSAELWGYGEYGPTSVLAGQFRRVFIDSWESLDAAKASFAETDLARLSTVEVNIPAEVPHTAPEWFDPADAGEAWGENDY